MARRKLSPEDEEMIAAEAAAASEAGRDLRQVRASRGANPTAVLSVRVPLELMQALRALAERRNSSVSDLVQAAIAAWAQASSPQVSTGFTKLVYQSSLPEAPVSRGTPGTWAPDRQLQLTHT